MLIIRHTKHSCHLLRSLSRDIPTILIPSPAYLSYSVSPFDFMEHTPVKPEMDASGIRSNQFLFCNAIQRQIINLKIVDVHLME